jgi:hypothetical protein
MSILVTSIGSAVKSQLGDGVLHKVSKVIVFLFDFIHELGIGIHLMMILSFRGLLAFVDLLMTSLALIVLVGGLIKLVFFRVITPHD